ncbi:MAG: phosphoribosylformylglycinamidine synthase, partial [Gammaproteobacteria bacterium]
SNAVPEIIDASERGGIFDLRRIPNDEPGMTPMEIWCNEAQERYVLAVAPDRLPEFERLCERERCPFAVIGEATGKQLLVVLDPHFNDRPVEMPMDVLLGKTPKMLRQVERRDPPRHHFNTAKLDLRDSAMRVLSLPTVADKGFLVTIGDRTVGGMIARDQMVGPWQVPISDVAVTAAGFEGYHGEAMAMGERAPIAVLDAPASGRMAVAEAITNIAAADIGVLRKVRLSANWMAACNQPGEDAALYDTVHAISDLCVALDIAIPVGKDSLSMQTVWQQDGTTQTMTAPVSLVISAFAPVTDIRHTLTPQLESGADTRLLLVDLGAGRNRLGGSCLTQVYGETGAEPPDIDDPILLGAFFTAIQELITERYLLAYHDRSDGGLFVTLCEMAFASRCGIEAHLDALGEDPVAVLFTEEAGAVIQVRVQDMASVEAVFAQHGLEHCVHVIGAPRQDDQLVFSQHRKELIAESRTTLQRAWSEVSFQMQSLRDNPECAEQEFAAKLVADDPGLHVKIRFDPAEDIAAPY